jgi:hypothetical protein
MNVSDFWRSLFDNAPEIIKAASQSPLGIFALSIIALTLLAAYFFREEKAKIKILIFIILAFGLAAYVASIRKSANETPRIVLLDGVNCQFGWISLGQRVNRKDTKSFIAANYRQAEDKNQKSLPEPGDTIKLNRHLTIVDANFQISGPKHQCSMEPPKDYRPDREKEFKIGDIDEGYVANVHLVATLPDIPNRAINYYWARISIK